jgi:glucokinase
LASGSAIARKTKERVAADPVEGKKFLEFARCSVDEIITPKVFEAYSKGIPLAIKVVEEVKEALIAGVAGLINAFNPAKMILGGGVITGLPELVDVIREGIPSRALKAPVSCVEVVRAQLKGDAGVIGAAAFAQQRRGHDTNKN